MVVSPPEPEDFERIGDDDGTDAVTEGDPDLRVEMVWLLCAPPPRATPTAAPAMTTAMSAVLAE